MTNFLLNVAVALALVALVIHIVATKVSAGIFDCVQQQIITVEQVHQIFECIKKANP